MQVKYLKLKSVITLMALVLMFSPGAAAMMGGSSGGGHMGGATGGGYSGSQMGGGEHGRAGNTDQRRRYSDQTMDRHQAERHASRYMERNWSGDYHMSGIADHGTYFSTHIRDRQGREMERLQIDKQTGKIQVIRP